MIVAAVAAVICANTPAFDAVHAFLQEPVAITFGPWSFSLSVEFFVNDFLMAIFFLLVGIELKYEMTVGELRRPRQALLPMLAAVGGVVVPASIYGFINRGGAVYGWAIPMATDIAFALGVLSLLGSRVPPALKVLFSTLAIADDLLAIAAIALFYGHAPHLGWLGAAAVVTGLLVLLNVRRHFRLAPYLALGLVLWFCLFQSGIHAPLAGVILAFTIPARSDIVASELVGWLGAKLPSGCTRAFLSGLVRMGRALFLSEHDREGTGEWRKSALGSSCAGSPPWAKVVPSRRAYPLARRAISRHPAFPRRPICVFGLEPMLNTRLFGKVCG